MVKIMIVAHYSMSTTAKSVGATLKDHVRGVVKNELLYSLIINFTALTPIIAFLPSTGIVPLRNKFKRIVIELLLSLL